MGWNDSLKILMDTQHRTVRDPLKRYLDLEKRRAHTHAMDELERNQFVAEEFETYLDVITSIHQDCCSTWDWNSILTTTAPEKPVRSDTHQIEALRMLERYKPTFRERVFGKAGSKRYEYARAVDEGMQKDEEQYMAALEKYEQDYHEWERSDELARIARGVLSRDPEIMAEVIMAVEPFTELAGYGSKINVEDINQNFVEINFLANLHDVVPAVSKRLLKSGSLSERKLYKTEFLRLSKSYVCGSALRIARELFALLPIRNVVINASDCLPEQDRDDGDAVTILSVVIPREVLGRLKINSIDPYDSMTDFVHKMKFTKSRGFTPVEKLEREDPR